MNRICLSAKSQLKCNFCTQWFSTFSDFATVQKYSVNACQDCMSNFHYSLVDPTTYNIYQVILIRTGDQLIPKSQQNQNQNQSLKKHFKQKKQEEVEKVKEDLWKIVRKLMETVGGKWEHALGTFEKEIQKSKQTDPCDENLLEYNEKSEGNLQKIVFEFKKAISEALGLPKFDSNENKENRWNNILAPKLRNIREKLMCSNLERLEKQQSYLKPFPQNQSRLNSNSRLKNSSLKSSNLKSSRSLLKSTYLHCQVTESVRSRSPYSRIVMQLKHKTKNQLDTYRTQISKLVKQPQSKIQFIEQLPEQNTIYENRTFGDKCLVEHLVQMKARTKINQNLCELNGYNLAKGNFYFYLQSLQLRETVSMLRFVKAKLNDSQFNCLLNFMKDHQQIQTIVLTNNKLTHFSIEGLLNFVQKYKEKAPNHIYLGNNYIKHSKAKPIIEKLAELGTKVHL